MYTFGDFELDPGQRSLTRSGQHVALTPKAFDLLLLLVSAHGNLVTKTEIIQALWPDATVEEGNVAFQVSALRKALGKDAGAWIETVPKYGYRFAAHIGSSSSSSRVEHPPHVANQRPKRWPHQYVLAAVAVAAVTVVGVTVRSRTHTEALTPAPLTSLLGPEVRPAVSPDGKEVAFVWQGPAQNNWDVYVKTDTAEDPIRFTSSPSMEFSPDWSADGRWIAFARAGNDGSSDIFLKAYPDGPERHLAVVGKCDTLPPPHEKILAWHPDGEHIVVSGLKQSGHCGLTAVSIVTGAIIPLTQPQLRSMIDSAVTIAPDGRNIAFVRGSIWPSFTVYVMPLTDSLKPAGAPYRVTRNDLMEIAPAWLPNSKELILAAGAGYADFHLFRVAAREGSQAVKLIGIGGGAFSPSVSRENTLVYGAADRNSLASLQRVDLTQAAASTHRITTIAGSTYLQQSPMHSPDGSKLVFESERSGTRELWISGPDGTNLRRVTHFNGPWVQSPRWSPDGRRIVCTVAASGQRDVYIVDAERGTHQRMTSDSFDESGVAWSADGNWIYFQSNVSGDFEVWKMPSHGGEAQRITKAGGRAPQESADGQFLYYRKHVPGVGGPDGPVAGIWRARTSGGPESLVVDVALAQPGFAMHRDGFFFMTSATNGSEVEVRFYKFASGAASVIARVPGPIGWGLSVAPNGKDLVFVRDARKGTDLNIVRLKG